MRAIVTGGAGFIGGHLTDALVECGADVGVIDFDNDAYKNPGARFYCEDLRTISRVSFREVDVVFHCAAVSHTTEAVADPIDCWDTNVMGSVRILELARRSNVPRVVLSSSNIVYAAETPYKASKLAMERAARVYDELYGVSTICLRYGNTYGPRQEGKDNVFPSMLRSLREKGFVELSGDGSQARDFVHVKDVVRSNLLAAESIVNGEIDICTGRNYSLNEVVEMLGVEKRHVAEREGDITDIIQDPEPARHMLGFEAEIPLELGLWDAFPDLVMV